MSTGRRFAKPGLWFSTMSVEVEYVKPRMTKTCGTCGKLPERLRLKVKKGAGRHATTKVYCQECGDAWIDEFKALAQRAKAYLAHKIAGVGCIRQHND